MHILRSHLGDFPGLALDSPGCNGAQTLLKAALPAARHSIVQSAWIILQSYLLLGRQQHRNSSSLPSPSTLSPSLPRGWPKKLGYTYRCGRGTRLWQRSLAFGPLRSLYVLCQLVMATLALYISAFGNRFTLFLLPALWAARMPGVLAADDPNLNDLACGA